MTAALCDWNDLESTQSFYVFVLQGEVGVSLPVPDGIHRSGEKEVGWPRMQAWLRILDMATSIVMLRAGVETQSSTAVAEALLRYLVSVGITGDAARDKIDFLVTWLCRRATLPDRASSPPAKYGSDASSAYYQRVLQALRIHDAAPLGDAELALVKKFDLLEEELSSCRDLHELMAFGIRNKARELKQALGQDLCHPGPLASAAAFNIGFGRHFERLFLDTAKRLGTDAASIETMASLVKSAAFVAADFVPETAHREATPQSGKRPPRKPASSVVDTPERKPPSVAVVKAEESKLADTTMSIRNHLVPADDNGYTVQLKNVVLLVSAAEGDAFRAAFAEEDSFRGQSAATFVELLSVYARMLVMFEEFKDKQHSTHLWQAQAESLSYLLTRAALAIERSDPVLSTAKARGLEERVAALNTTREKMLALAREVRPALSMRDQQAAPTGTHSA
jgi:hypothetical protein